MAFVTSTELHVYKTNYWVSSACCGLDLWTAACLQKGSCKRLFLFSFFPPHLLLPSHTAEVKRRILRVVSDSSEHLQGANPPGNSFFPPRRIFIALKMEGASLSSRLLLCPSANRTNLAPVQCQMAQTQPRRCCLPGRLSRWRHGASVTRGGAPV